MLSVDQLEDKLIDLAFAEDIGDGDHTTLCCIPEDAMGKSHLLIKEDGVLAGVEMAKKVFARFDPTMKVEVLLQDGTHVKKGDIAMIVEGKTRSLLQTEKSLQWTGNTLDLVELVYGLSEMGCIDNGETPLKVLAPALYEFFGLDTKECYRYYSAIKLRKNPSRTYFIDKMQKKLNEKIRRDEELERMRR